MNWEAIGAIGEIVGAIAVLVTLIYLAMQIRQNTYQTRAAATQDTIHLWNEISQAVLTDRSVAELIEKGNNNLSSLDPADRQRYSNYNMMIVRSAWAQDQRNKAGALEFDDLTTVRWLSDWMQQNPGLAEMWGEIKIYFPLEFQQRVEKEVDKRSRDLET